MNLLITGAWTGAAQYFPILRESGHSICFLQQEADPLPCDPAWVEGVICNGLFLHHPIESFSSLRYIQLTSAGFDRIPMDYVHAKGIEIHNARGVYSVPMAEFAVAGVLAVYKDLAQFQRQQEQHIWKKNRNLRELAGKRVVIVGCGDVGTECAKRFQAFGCSVTGVNRSVKSQVGFDRVVGLEALDRELAEADVVVVTVALTPETVRLVKAGHLKQDAVLVNISRGSIVDLKDMACAAVLDVLDEEPLPQHSDLWDRDHVLITPHNSFVGDGNAARLADLILKNLNL